MGFLEGLLQTGRYYNLRDEAGALTDIMNYLELPLDIPSEQSDPTRRPQVIQIALDVTDPEAIPLDVQGVESLSLADYPGPFYRPEKEAKPAYLYRSPKGSNVSWSYSPIYRLGKGISDSENAEKALLSEDLSWEKDNKCRFYKLHKSVLADYEQSGFFTKGSTERVITSLVDDVEKLISLWSDRNRSYLMVFGILGESGFLYPGQIPVFTAYFRSKLAERQEKSSPKEPQDCTLCHKNGAAGRTLDEVFKFSTFDKPGFLPDGNQNNLFNAFPICEDCYSLLARGLTEAENNFATRIGISGVELLIIPEMIGQTTNLKRLQQKFTNYIASGVAHENQFFESISAQDASYVFHFLFTERNQAQIRLHRMVEDVPPSHFRKLLNLWNQSRQKIFPKLDHAHSLDSVIRQITAMVQSLAGKTEGEKEVMKSLALNLIANLFANAFIEVGSLKRAAVARLPGLTADPEWLNDNSYSGAFKLERLLLLFEFLYAYNQSLN
jgi:CRISPR-associated protein Csh1